MSDSDTTYGPANDRKVPAIGNDTTSHWWFAVLLPTITLISIFLLAFAVNTDDVGEWLGVFRLPYLVLIILSSFLSFAAIYIDADKIRDRNLDWYPRWWVYYIAGMLFSGALALLLIDDNNGVAELLLGINMAMTPVGIGYVANRISHVGIS